jgi:hypothetical protein
MSPDELFDDARAELIAYLAVGRRGSTYGVTQIRPEFRRWLLESGLAFLDADGLLKPTRLGLEIGRALDPEA